MSRRSRKINRDAINSALQQAKMARINGAQAQAPTFTWEEVDEQYTQLEPKCAFIGTLVPFLRNKDLTSKLKDPAEVTRLVQIAQNDTFALLEKLRKIRASYNSKSGAAKSEDELFNMIEVSEEYVEWAYQYDSVVLPNLNKIFDIFIEAGADLDRGQVGSASELVAG